MKVPACVRKVRDAERVAHTTMRDLKTRRNGGGVGGEVRDSQLRRPFQKPFHCTDFWHCRCTVWRHQSKLRVLRNFLEQIYPSINKSNK